MMRKLGKWLLVAGLASSHLVLSGCFKPKTTVIGVVDDSLLISADTIEKMGLEEFKKHYLGKEVTVTDFYYRTYNGGWRPENGQCLNEFITKSEKTEYQLKLMAFMNDFPDYVLEDSVDQFDLWDSKAFDYPSEIAMPLETGLCKPCDYREGMAYNPKCYYTSPHLKITGKVVAANGSTRATLAIKVKGVEY